jgi:2-oxoglutarate dehydrogenase E2 component (dihydrolipoamide succinyltransferase)
MSIEIKTPMLPESVSEATVLAWHKNVGDGFRRDELLVEIETEKIVLEVPAPSDGVVDEILKSAGDTIYENDVLAVVSTSAQESEELPLEIAAQKATQDEKTEVEESSTAVKTEEKLSPAVRRLVAEHGIDVSKVAGSGKEGRVTKADLVNLIESKDTEAPQKPADDVVKEAAKSVAAEGREVRRQSMSRIRRTIADRLVQAQHTAALLTTFNEVDMSAVMALRKQYRELFENKHDARLGFMSFFVKAAVESLKSIPAVNAIIDGNDIVYHDYYDVGIAVSSPRGLVVPIVRDAHLKGFAQIEQQIRDFGERAKSGTLSLNELSGGTFTITNGGVFGSLVSTPIVNLPQSAILGMHKIQERPVVVNGAIVARPMMYLALTYDHRIIDGREAVTFLIGIKDAIEDPSRLLLEL